MESYALTVDGIPSLIWGGPSEKVHIYVHGKMSRKEHAERFAAIVEGKGFQTLSFDLPEHGERSGDHARRCDVWNGVHDLGAIAEYAFDRWSEVALFACSLGAYFSLNAYADRRFSKCLFLSPIVDMAYLIDRMFEWNGVTEALLREKREIYTPLDTLRWDWYQYARSHPVARWDTPTSILYGDRDELQSREVIERFAHNFGCGLTVSAGSEHAFMAPAEVVALERWLIGNA